MSASCGCGRKWTGLAEAHCPVCHAHFSTVSGFDKHKPDTTGCTHPEDVGLVGAEGPNGVTYRAPGRECWCGNPWDRERVHRAHECLPWAS